MDKKDFLNKIDKHCNDICAAYTDIEDAQSNIDLLIRMHNQDYKYTKEESALIKKAKRYLDNEFIQ